MPGTRPQVCRWDGEWLADYGSLYLILLGLLAIFVTVKLPNGVWGWIADHWDVSLFPTGRRLELETYALSSALRYSALYVERRQQS